MKRLPSASARARALESEWRDYRRGLHADPRAHEDAFDALWEHYRAHADILGPNATMDDVFIAMLVGQERDLHALREAIVGSQSSSRADG